MRMGKLSFALVTIGSVLGALPAAAQVQERTIRWGHLNNTDHPVSFGVQKLRVIPNPVYLETFKAFKANPVPMAFGELYTALENKTVDGQENPYSVILSNKFYEVQKYVSATNHTFTQNIIIVSKKFWDRLSAEEQKMFRDAYAETREYQRDQTKLAAEKALGELKAKGMQFNDIAPAEYARMQDAVKPVVARFSGDYDQTKVKLFNDELARIRSKSN